MGKGSLIDFTRFRLKGMTMCLPMLHWFEITWCLPNWIVHAARIFDLPQQQVSVRASRSCCGGQKVQLAVFTTTVWCAMADGSDSPARSRSPPRSQWYVKVHGGNHVMVRLTELGQEKNVYTLLEAVVGKAQRHLEGLGAGDLKLFRTEAAMNDGEHEFAIDTPVLRIEEGTTTATALYAFYDPSDRFQPAQASRPNTSSCFSCFV